MGIFQKYIRKDADGNPVLNKYGKPIKEGPWFIQYPHSRDPKTGKTKYRTEKASFSKKKAEAMFRSKCDAFTEMEKFGVQIDTEMTFSKLMDWGLNQEIMKDKASASDDQRRANHLKAHFGDRRAIQITPLDVENFRRSMIKTISDRTKRPFSGSSVNKMVTLARRIYYLGMDQGIVKSNPFARRGVFKEEPKGQYIPDDEFWKIYHHIVEHLKPIILVAYLTGMRRAEILELTWDRVNLTEGYIDLTPSDTKTEEPRRIYFNSIPMLKGIFSDAADKRKKSQGLVFTNSNGGPIPKYFRNSLIKACNKAKVGPYRLHDLRHTFNTNMTKAGVNQVVIMKLTGHKTNAMFVRYSHLDNEQGQAAMEKLNGFLGKRRNDEAHTN